MGNYHVSSCMLSEYKIKKAEGFGSVAHTASGTGTWQFLLQPPALRVGSSTCQVWPTAPPRGNDCLTVPRGHIPVMCLNADHSQCVAAKMKTRKLMKFLGWCKSRLRLHS